MNLFDTIIIGSGPAAYSCALYLKDKNILLLEGGVIGNNGPGGQLTITTIVDNYPCHKTINGPDLVDLFKKHANVFSKQETVNKLIISDDKFIVHTELSEYTTYSVVIASGAAARRLFVEGTNDDEYWNKGISACAVCDGWFFRNGVVAVIGGGDSAMEETRHLSGICSKVILIHRKKEFRARRDMVEKISKLSNVEIVTPCELEKAVGDGNALTGIEVRNVETNLISKIELDGLFFGIGHDPNSSFVDCIEKKDYYIVTDNEMNTSVKGIFACGDVQDRRYRQANTAAGTGCIAGLSVLRYLEKKEIL